jgi:hypothetical protein
MNKDVAAQFDVDVVSASVSPQFDVANWGNWRFGLSVLVRLKYLPSRSLLVKSATDPRLERSV